MTSKYQGQIMKPSCGKPKFKKKQKPYYFNFRQSISGGVVAGQKEVTVTSKVTVTYDDDDGANACSKHGPTIISCSQK